MKRSFVLSTFVCFAMICACQKQDSAAEAKFTQAKAELDAREKALDEREKVLGDREKARANGRIIPSRQQARNPAEMEAEREKRLQQLPPELRALIPNREQMDSARLAKEREAGLQGRTSDPEQAKAERERRIQQLPPELQALVHDQSLVGAGTGTARADRAERLRRLEEERRKMMDATASPNSELPDRQPGSPSPSPTPQ